MLTYAGQAAKEASTCRELLRGRQRSNRDGMWRTSGRRRALPRWGIGRLVQLPPSAGSG